MAADYDEESRKSEAGWEMAVSGGGRSRTRRGDEGEAEMGRERWMRDEEGSLGVKP
jgi:hypothetical protein